MTERWNSMPRAGERSLRMVSNMYPFDIRCLARHVADEYMLSATPLVDHVCSMCGQLLGPPTKFNKRSRECGKPGRPCQVRGVDCPWDALPLFLLLWSKRTLSCRIPSLFAYDVASGRLVLRSDFSSAPWLHWLQATAHLRDIAESLGLPTRRDGLEILDPKNPWWYCLPCHSYWQRISKPDSKSGPIFLWPTSAFQCGIISKATSHAGMWI